MNELVLVLLGALAGIGILLLVALVVAAHAWHRHQNKPDTPLAPPTCGICGEPCNDDRQHKVQRYPITIHGVPAHRVSRAHDECAKLIEEAKGEAKKPTMVEVTR